MDIYSEILQKSLIYIRVSHLCIRHLMISLDGEVFHVSGILYVRCGEVALLVICVSEGKGVNGCHHQFGRYLFRGWLFYSTLSIILSFPIPVDRVPSPKTDAS